MLFCAAILQRNVPTLYCMYSTHLHMYINKEFGPRGPLIGFNVAEMSYDSTARLYEEGPLHSPSHVCSHCWQCQPILVQCQGRSIYATK